MLNLTEWVISSSEINLSSVPNFSFTCICTDYQFMDSWLTLVFGIAFFSTLFLWWYSEKKKMSELRDWNNRQNSKGKLLYQLF